jgi:hypothetical protein
MSFIKNTSKTGIALGGGVAAVAQIAGPYLGSKLLEKDPTSQVGGFIVQNPWASGVVAGGATGAALWFTKRREAAVAAWLATGVVVAPSLISMVLAKMQSPALAPAGGATNGFGIAVAEPRGLGSPPRIELFSAAPESIQLLAAPNAPESMGVQPALNPAVFGGSAF